jgi:hypothetical protein
MGIDPLTHQGGLLAPPPLFRRPVAKKVMKLKKFGKISYSMEIILGLKLSSGVSYKKSHFIQVIHGSLGETQNLGARI